MARFEKDHFSPVAASYALHRPRYPEPLYRYLAEIAPKRSCVWDCATGSGQAARDLAERFERVYGTDLSPEQLAHAERDERISYVLAAAECAPFRAHSIGLVTVAQALHWFDIPRFLAEARRVAVPGGVLAIWGYVNPLVEPALDEILNRELYAKLERHWAPERRILAERYRSIELPGEELDAPPISMTAEANVEDLLNLFRTWSAVRTHDRATGGDIVSALSIPLRAAWGGIRTVHHPFVLRCCRF